MSRVEGRNVALISLGLGFLLIAWVFATPPFGAPDESAHYLRTVAIDHGSFLGPKVLVHAATPGETDFIGQDARGVVVDRRTAPPGIACIHGKQVPATHKCLAANYEGNFEPLPYLVPSVATAAAGTPHRGLWLGRLASAFVCFGFIALAVALLSDDSLWSTLGLLAAVTPTTLFVSSVINPNGLEIAANLAFVAALQRLVRGAAIGRGTWVAATASGTTVILAWQLGWLFVCIDVLAVGAVAGRARLRELVADYRGPIKRASLILLCAFLLYLAWGIEARLLHGAFGISPLGPGVAAGLSALRTVLYGAVAVFGQLDITLKGDGYYWIWWLLVLLILSGALATARRAEAAALALVALVTLAFPVLFYAWVERHSGFGLQARHVMPVLALIPLIAGGLVAKNRTRLPRALLAFVPGVVVAVVAAYQLFAWWVNAQSSAGTNSTFGFMSGAHWSPAAGWVPWAVAAVLGTALLLTAAASGLRDGYMRIWLADAET